MENYEFIALGDVVTEPFIRLKDAEATCDLDQENCKLSLRFGDKVPYESAEICRAVGNSANAAVSAARLGVPTALLAYMGDDEIAQGNIEELTKNGVSTKLIQKIPGMPSNYHYVLWYDVERTILVKHTEFPYKMDMQMSAPKWIYLSSLASNSAEYHDQISDYLTAHPETQLTYQPGTFQMKLGIERTKKIYEHTTLFVVNYEEAQRILQTTEKDVKKLMDSLHDLGPKIVVVTDGIKGAYAREENGTHWFMGVYPHVPFERTGAGDAFASTFTAALMLGKTVEEALYWAPINSQSVVQKVGAQKGLLTRPELEAFLAKAPVDYKPKQI